MAAQETPAAPAGLPSWDEAMAARAEAPLPAFDEAVSPPPPNEPLPSWDEAVAAQGGTLDVLDVEGPLPERTLPNTALSNVPTPPSRGLIKGSYDLGKTVLQRVFTDPLMGPTEQQALVDAAGRMYADPSAAKEVFDEKGNLRLVGQGGFKAGLRGIDMLQQGGYALGMWGADAIGAKKVSDWMREGVLANKKEIEANPPSIARLADVGKGIPSGPAGALTRARQFRGWLTESAFEQLPNILLTYGSGGLSRLLVKKIITRGVEKAVVSKALEAASTKLALAEAGGVAASSVGQEIGSIYNDMVEAGFRGPQAVLAAGLGGFTAGITESIMPVLNLRRLRGAPVRSPIEAIIRSTMGDAIMEKGLMRLGFPVFENMIVEGGTEWFQTAVEQAALLSQDPKVQGAYWESLVKGYELQMEREEARNKGAAVGGLFGGGVNVVSMAREKITSVVDKRAFDLGVQRAIEQFGQGRDVRIDVGGAPMTVQQQISEAKLPRLPGIEGAEVVKQALSMGLDRTAAAVSGLAPPKVPLDLTPPPFAGISLAEPTVVPATPGTAEAEAALPLPSTYAPISPGATTAPTTATVQPAPAEAAASLPAAPVAPGVSTATAPAPATPPPIPAPAPAPVTTNRALGLRSWLAKLFPNLTNLEVADTGEQFPDEVKADIARRGLKLEDVDAFYHQGRVIFNAAKFPTGNPTLVYQKVIHEAAIHLGLRQVLGEKKFSRLINDIYRNLPAEARAAVAARNGILPKDIAQIGEEWLAYEAERVARENKTNRLWSKIAAAFRIAARNIGFRVKLSDVEIARLIAKGIRGAEQVAQGTGRAQPIASVTRLASSEQLAEGPYAPGQPLAQVDTIRFEPEGQARLSVTQKEQFEAVGWQQRGEPESRMLAFQRALGGGLHSYLAEHVGDLSHRASELNYDGSGPLSWGNIVEKVRTSLKYLTQEYGFEKERLENLRANALTTFEQENPNDADVQNLEALRERVHGLNRDDPAFDDTIRERNKAYWNLANSAKVEKVLGRLDAEARKAGQAYADAHRTEVKPLTDLQALGREAAIAVGEYRFADATRTLTKLKSILDEADRTGTQTEAFFRGYERPSEIRYSFARVRQAKLEGEREYVPETVGAGMKGAFSAVKDMLYTEAATLSDLIPPTTDWWQPERGQSLIEYLRRYYSAEGRALLRKTFAGDNPPEFVKDRMTWYKIKDQLNTAASGSEDPAAGLVFLSGNRKTGGVSLDFGLGTCLPSENCSVCYAKGGKSVFALAKARTAHSVVMALYPKQVGAMVAAYVNSVGKGELPFLRINGAGDTTFDWQATVVNTIIKNINRPVHIFSRSHVSRAPGTVGLDSISNGHFDPNDIENGVAVYKMGSIDKQLMDEYIDKYGIEFLRDNLAKRGIVNSYLVKDVEDIPRMLELKRQGVFFVMHINSTKAVVRALNEAGLLATSENYAKSPGLVAPACPCALETGPFLNGCATCLVGGGPCFGMGTQIAMSEDGELIPLESLLSGDRPAPRGQLVEMARIGVPHDDATMMAEVAAHAYEMAAEEIEGKAREAERLEKGLIIRNPRDKVEILRITEEDDLADAQWVADTWRDYAKSLRMLVAKYKNSAGRARLLTAKKLSKVEKTELAKTDQIAAMNRAVENAKPKTRLSVSDSETAEPEPLVQTVPASQTVMGKLVAGIDDENVPEHDREYVTRFSVTPVTPLTIANADVNQALAEAGQPSLEEMLGLHVTKSDKELIASVKAKMAADHSWVDRIVEREEKKPGQISDEEALALDIWMLELRTRFEEEAKAAQEAEEAGRPDYAAVHGANAEFWAQPIQRLAQVTARAGTEQGRAFRARQLALNWDFTLASLVRKKMEANGWRRLTKDEMVELARLAEAYRVRTEQVERENAKLREQLVEAELKAARGEVADINPQVMEFAKEWISGVKQKAKNARDRFKAKWEKLHPESPLRYSAEGGQAVPPLPDDLLRELAIMGGAKLAANITDPSAWESAMVEETGEFIRPYLTAARAASEAWLAGELAAGRAELKTRRAPRKVPGAPVAPKPKAPATPEPELSIEDRIKITKSKIKTIVEKRQGSTEPIKTASDDLYYAVQALVRELVEQDPIMTRDDLITQVHKVLLEMMPEITREETMDAISGRGRVRYPDPEAIARTIRDLKAQIRIASHILDIEAKRARKRTGFQYDKPSDEQRRLMQHLEELKRRIGEVTTNTDAQLATYLDSRKTWYRNRISDLRYEMEKRELIVKTKSPGQTDPELDALRAEYEQVRQEHDKIFVTPDLTPEQRLELAERAAERIILKMEKDLAEGRRTLSRQPSKMASDKLQALKTRIAQLKAAQEFAARGEPMPPDLSRPEDFKRWFDLERQIKDIEQQIATGNVIPLGKAARPTDLPSNAALADRLEKLREQRERMRKALAPPPLTDLQKAERALQKQVDKMEADLAAGRMTVKAPPNPLASAKLEALRTRLVQLKAEQEWAQRHLSPPPDLTDPADIKRWFALDKSIRNIEQQLANQNPFGPKKTIQPTDKPTNLALAAKLEDLKRQRNEMRKAMRPGKLSPLEQAIHNRMGQLRRQIADYEERLADRDFAPRKRPEPTDLTTNPEAVKLLAQRDRIVADFYKALAKDRYDKLTRAEKIWHGIRTTRQAMVNLASSADFSGLRQGLIGMASLVSRVTTHPFTMTPKVIRIFKQMFQAYLSSAMADRIMRAIANRPNAQSGADRIGRIEYSAIESPEFTKSEENARSIFDEWARLPMWEKGKPIRSFLKAPFKATSRMVSASNRAFAVFLNATRATLFDELLDTNFRDRAPTENELRVIGNWVNVATGRGKLNPAVAKGAATFIWAPKLLTSRVQFLLGQPLWGGGNLRDSARARRIIAKEYARVIATGYMLALVSSLFDEKKERSPLSSDFGKIVRGNTRIDLWGGLQQVTVLGARLLTGKTKTTSGRVIDLVGAKRYGQTDMSMIIPRFLRTKIRPDVGIALDFINRGDFRGEPLTPGGVAQDLLVPLPFRDIGALMKDRGFTEAMIIEAMNQFGAGVSVYEPNAKAPKREYRTQ